MTDFPSSVYEPRTKNNKSGVVYIPANDTQLYVEDVTKLDDEVVAMEKNLADKINRIIQLIIYDKDTAVPNLTNDVFRLTIPEDLDGYKVVGIGVCVNTADADDFLDLDVRNSRLSHSIFSARPTIDATEKTSYTSEQPGTIDTDYDDLQTGDELIFDLKQEYGSFEGLQVILTVQKVIT